MRELAARSARGADAAVLATHALAWAAAMAAAFWLRCAAARLAGAMGGDREGTARSLRNFKADLARGSRAKLVELRRRERSLASDGSRSEAPGESWAERVRSKLRSWLAWLLIRWRPRSEERGSPLPAHFGPKPRGELAARLEACPLRSLAEQAPALARSSIEVDRGFKRLGPLRLRLRAWQALALLRALRLGLAWRWRAKILQPFDAGTCRAAWRGARADIPAPLAAALGAGWSRDLRRAIDAATPSLGDADGSPARPDWEGARGDEAEIDEELAYERACRLWAMARAWAEVVLAREAASSAMGPEFARFVPTPSTLARWDSHLGAALSARPGASSWGWVPDARLPSLGELVADACQARLALACVAEPAEGVSRAFAQAEAALLEREAGQPACVDGNAPPAPKKPRRL